MNKGTLPSHYVGIGASAGGLEAIEHLFKNMPRKTGLAFIVVQHLSPDYESLMPELLARHTHLNVRRAENNLWVEADSVYLIPAKKNLQIFHGKLLLSNQDRSQGGLNLPIDILLNSLAEDQEEKAIAIILSGTGSDGTRGISAIKGNNGMVMVQTPEHAKFDGMPSSAIATGLVDFVLPCEAMPQQLLAFVQHPTLALAEYAQRANAHVSNDELTRIFAVLRKTSKIDFTHYKPSTVMRRLERRMNLKQITDLKTYADVLEKNPAEATALYQELLIGVTSFFRDPEMFEMLKIHLKGLLDELQLQKREVRFWCAGCSTGEEAYSLAMLAQEYMRQTKYTLNVKIFATDVDERAIAKAAQGIYPDSIRADVERDDLNRYFVPLQNQRLQITRELRQMVVFARHNLIKDPPFTNIDLVSCRNLLIYLEPVLQKRALDMFNFALNANALLVLGSSENINENTLYFDGLDSKNKIFRSKGKRKAASFNTHSNIPLQPFPDLPHTPLMSPANRFHPHESNHILERFLDTAAGAYLPPSLIVNEQKEVIHLQGGASEYLRLNEGMVSNDVTKMVSKEIGIALATGLQKVFKQKEELHYSNVRVAKGEQTFNMSLRLFPLPDKPNQLPLAAIFFEHPKAITREDINGYDLGLEAEQRINDLEQELQFTRENLQATVEELETSNEELQATNEELLASNEELQSTNQELQSVNEELHTVNAEHQRKIFELTELNNVLDNLFAATQIATLFLDENLEIRRFTPETAKLFPIIEQDIGRSFAHLAHGIKLADPNEVAEQVLQDGQMREYEVQAANKLCYLMRITPYNINTHQTIGVVMSFINIHEAKKQRDAAQFYFDFAETMLLVLDADACIQRINRKACEVLGYEIKELIGKNWFEMVLAEPDKQSTQDAFQHIINGDLELFKDMQNYVLTKHGERRLIAWHNTIQRDEQGNIISTLSSGEDITHQSRTTSDTKPPNEANSR